MSKPREKTGLKRFILLAQTGTIVGLLLWLSQESRNNAFMQAWFSRNFPLGLFLLNAYTTSSIIISTIIAAAYLSGLLSYVARAVSGGRENGMIGDSNLGSRVAEDPRSDNSPLQSTPFYETVELGRLAIGVALLTQGSSLWFITAASFHVSSFPPDSYYYLTSLPIVYWWGLAATLAIIAIPIFQSQRARTAQELAGLGLLALYLIGLPSFSYQDPRFLDAYYHTGNALDLINSGGWAVSPNWYVHQFPGAFSYIAQLSTVAGVDPLQVMKFFPVGLSLTVVFFTYVIARMFSPTYAAIASGLVTGGLWFQLHVSPQAIELPLYLGFIFVLVKIIEDQSRRRLWTAISLSITPIFIASHPETPIAVSMGLVILFILSALQGGTKTRRLLAKIAPSTISLAVIGSLWWSFIAVDARLLVQTSILDKAIQSLSQFPAGVSPQNVPANPASSYATSILLEQAASVIVWGAGLLLLLLIGRFRDREKLVYALFLAAVATIPIAAFGRADVLQRSYLFALFPFAIIAAWLLEARTKLSLRGRSLVRPFQVMLLVSMILFAVFIPVTRYGLDPFQYIPNSSLTVDRIAAGLGLHSVLFLHPEEDGWRFFAGLNGATSQPKLEQGSLSGKTGGYVKPNSDPTLTPFNLTYTQSDSSADYIVLSDYYLNVYHLRFGTTAQPYLDARTSFENNLTQHFDLAYSTGFDRLYVNPALT